METGTYNVNIKETKYQKFSCQSQMSSYTSSPYVKIENKKVILIYQISWLIYDQRKNLLDRLEVVLRL